MDRGESHTSSTRTARAAVRAPGQQAACVVDTTHHTRLVNPPGVCSQLATMNPLAATAAFVATTIAVCAAAPATVLAQSPPHPSAAAACAAFNLSTLIDIKHGFGEIAGYSRNSGCGYECGRKTFRWDNGPQGFGDHTAAGTTTQVGVLPRHVRLVSAQRDCRREIPTGRCRPISSHVGAMRRRVALLSVRPERLRTQPLPWFVRAPSSGRRCSTSRRRGTPSSRGSGGRRWARSSGARGRTSRCAPISGLTMPLIRSAVQHSSGRTLELSIEHVVATTPR